MPKKITIVLIVLIDLCSGLSLLRVRPVGSCPAKLWNTVEVNVRQTKKRAVQYYQSVRLMYDIARQLQRQEKERTWKPALEPAIREYSGRFSTSSISGAAEKLESKPRVKAPSRRIDCRIILQATSQRQLQFERSRSLRRSETSGKAHSAASAPDPLQARRNSS